jgi:hypothetical protein
VDHAGDGPSRSGEPPGSALTKEPSVVLDDLGLLAALRRPLSHVQAGCADLQATTTSR